MSLPDLRPATGVVYDVYMDNATYLNPTDEARAMLRHAQGLRITALWRLGLVTADEMEDEFGPDFERVAAQLHAAWTQGFA